MEVLVVFLFAVYFGFLAFVFIGWKRTLATRRQILNHTPLVSIVIAARNEGNNISALLKDILKQSYDKFEVIVVDDHSTDNTHGEITALSLDNPRIKVANSVGHGKKYALSRGLQLAGGEIIVTTDADCHVQRHWLEAMISYFQHKETMMVIGAVKIGGSTAFAKLQAHEFLSLTATSAATLSWAIPSMCNGANLAFRKSAFEAVGGYHGSLHVASGDDQFLMHKIQSYFGDAIRFAADERCTVTTKPCFSTREFFHQRIRWAGKWRVQKSMYTTVLSVFIFSFHCMIISLPACVLMNWVDPLVAGGLVVLKVLGEWTLLSSVARFVGLKWNLLAFLGLQIIYSPYAAFIGLTSGFMPFEWKGRRIKTASVRAAEL